MLALVAGTGRLPVLLAERLEQEGAPWRLCALEGVALDLDAAPLRFRLETLGSFLAGLRADGVTEVCFAGGVRRPALDPARVDAATAPLLSRLAAAMPDGDDATLRALLALFEEAGLRIRAAHDILPELLPAPGLLAGPEPDARARADAARGAGIVAAMGAADVGQACVVAQGQALAVEALPGTDRMLADLARLDPALRPDPSQGRGVLVKAPKPGQDRRVDLPTIGPETVSGAARAGLAGIVIEAGGVQLLDRDEAVARAVEAGLFLWVREAAG